MIGFSHPGGLGERGFVDEFVARVTVVGFEMALLEGHVIIEAEGWGRGGGRIHAESMA